MDEYTQKNIESICSTYEKDLPPHWAIEQYLPAQFFLENGFNIKELREYENVSIKGDKGYIRIYEMKNFSNISNFRISDINISESISQYMKEQIGHHLWISKKVIGMDELLMNIIKEMYSDLNIKIHSILNIKNNKKKTLI